MYNPRQAFVYILTNKNKTVLYIGTTNNLVRRLKEHRELSNKNSFTAKYKTNILVYYELCAIMPVAIFREKKLKNLVRRKKDELINNFNPTWKDLSDDLIG